VFEHYDKDGGTVLNADEYIPVGQTGYAGYNADDDKGALLTIRAGTGNNIQPTFYYSWAMPPDTGADWYSENIAQCNQTQIPQGYVMTQEPGNMVGPTVQGIDALIAQDPTAYWDDGPCNCVKSPLGRSPRVFPIPLYDPEEYDNGKVSGRNATLVMVGWIGFFVEGRNGNDVYGRITPILGVIDGNAGPAPDGAFARAVRLVE
jgi:hypothetical protein